MSGVGGQGTLACCCWHAPRLPRWRVCLEGEGWEAAQNEGWEANGAVAPACLSSLGLNHLATLGHSSCCGHAQPAHVTHLSSVHLSSVGGAVQPYRFTRPRRSCLPACLHPDPAFVPACLPAAPLCAPAGSALSASMASSGSTRHGISSRSSSAAWTGATTTWVHAPAGGGDAVALWLPAHARGCCHGWPPLHRGLTGAALHGEGGAGQGCRACPGCGTSQAPSAWQPSRAEGEGLSGAVC